MDTITRHVEEWRPVNGWPYEVSSLGRVRNASGHIMSPTPNGQGYLQVSMRCAGLRRQAFVHRLVALAFLGPPPSPDCHADHINNDRARNHRENLRWLSPDENRSLRQLAKGTGHASAKLTEDLVIAIRANREANNRQLAAVYGVSRETIRDVRLGKVWKHVN